MSEFENEYRASLEKLKSEALNEFNVLSDPVNAVKAVGTSLSRFIDENFNAVSGNENMIEVNTVLVTAMANIKNYLLAEPNRVVTDLNKAKSRYESYDRCLNIFDELNNSKPPPPETSNLELEEETLETEVQVGSETEVVVESSSDNRPEHEELWNKPSDPNRPRKVGQRPESLRKIRQEMFKNQGEESQPEDI